MINKLEWLDSSGGPLLLCNEKDAPSWGGIEFASDFLDLESQRRWSGNPSAPPTDYDRACSVQAYVGKLSVGNFSLLVLDEEYVSITWWQPSERDSILLIRWMAADSEDILVQNIEKLPETIWQLEQFQFRVSEGNLYLFESTYTGLQVLEHDFTDVIKFALPRGEYSIESGIFQPDSQNSFMLHRLKKVPDKL